MKHVEWFSKEAQRIRRRRRELWKAAFTFSVAFVVGLAIVYFSLEFLWEW